MDSQRNLMLPENVKIGFTDDLSLQDLEFYLSTTVYEDDPETYIPYKQTAKTTEPREKRTVKVMYQVLQAFVKYWDWGNKCLDPTYEQLAKLLNLPSPGSVFSTVYQSKKKDYPPNVNIREFINEDIRKLAEKLGIDLDQNQCLRRLDGGLKSGLLLRNPQIPKFLTGWFG